jgi:hypothetical protein
MFIVMKFSVGINVTRKHILLKILHIIIPVNLLVLKFNDNALSYPARISASVYVLTLFSGIPRAFPSICNI